MFPLGSSSPKPIVRRSNAYGRLVFHELLRESEVKLLSRSYENENSCEPLLGVATIRLPNESLYVELKRLGAVPKEPPGELVKPPESSLDPR